MATRAHLYTLAGVCALPRAYLRTGNFPRAPIWRLCRNKGLHPLRRFAAIPAHPQKQYTRRWRLYHFCGFYYPIREVIPIAIYHWNIGIVSRGKGKSAVAAAAYRSGEKLTNEWDGMTHDYTRKGGVVHTEIMLPPHAPPSFSDRSTLWNSVELYEKAGNAQLAREIDAALPIELSREEQIRLVREYYCLSRSRISKDACPGVTIREDALLDMLADMLQDALDTALGQYTLSLAELPRQAADRAELREKITSRKQEIQRLRGIVRSLYENLVQGVLTKDEYFDYKEKYESRIADLAVEMEQLEDGLRTMDAQAEQHRALEQDAAQIKTDRALTGALIERLIDRIEVSHDKQIAVRYRFQSEFETYAEVLEQCRNM